MATEQEQYERLAQLVAGVNRNEHSKQRELEVALNETTSLKALLRARAEMSEAVQVARARALADARVEVLREVAREQDTDEMRKSNSISRRIAIAALVVSILTAIFK